jgi:anti-anti-sigma regulatory factor
MEIRQTREQGRVVVTVFHIKGEITAETYEQLQTSAKAAYAAGTRNLALDLSEVKYVSSAGIRAINNIFVLLRGDMPEESDEVMHKGIAAGTYKSPHLKLVNPSPQVKRTFATMGLDMFLEMYDELKDAVASF